MANPLLVDLLSRSISNDRRFSSSWFTDVILALGISKCDAARFSRVGRVELRGVLVLGLYGSSARRFKRSR